MLGITLVLAMTRSGAPPVPRSTAPRNPAHSESRERFEFLKTRSAITGRIPAGIRARELDFVRERFPRGMSKASEDFEWRSRGPHNVGGRTRALAIDVTDENVILAGGVSGGLWRSEDAGRSWTKMTDPSHPHNVTAVVQDVRPGHTDTWFMGTGERRGSADHLEGRGLFRSDDGGRNWRALPSSPARGGSDTGFANISRLITNPDAPSAQAGASAELYAATDFGIFRTRDGGVSWEPVAVETPGAGYTDIVRADSSGTFYAVVGEQVGIFAHPRVVRSPDGENWTEITPGDWSPVALRAVIAIAPSDERIVYFLNSRSGFWQYTYESGDGSGLGGVWENRSVELESVGFGSYGGYTMALAVHPDDPDIVFTGGIRLTRSTDAFRTVDNAANIGRHLNHHPDQHAIVFKRSDPNVMYSAHDGGVSRTTNVLADEVDWESLEYGYITSQFYSIAIDQSEPGDSTLIGGMQDNGTYFANSMSREADWSWISGGDGGFAAIARDKGYYYISYQNGAVLREVIDATGQREDELGRETRIDPPAATQRLFVHPYLLNPANTNQMFYAGESIWRNEDLAGLKKYTQATLQNWTELTGTRSDFEFTTAMEISTEPPNRLYYVREFGRMYRLDDAHRGNPRPVEITSRDFPDSDFLWMNSIAVDRQDADHMLICFSNYETPSIFFSPDGGSFWTDISGNLERVSDGSGDGPSVRWVEILNHGGQRYYFAGTSVGLFYTTELRSRITQWHRTGGDIIGSVPVDMIESRDEDGLVVVATHGNGIYSTNAGSLAPVAAERSVDLPSGIDLSQNVPNPFSGRTTVAFSLDKPASVSLTVYDVAGRRVEDLLTDERLGSGRHEHVWDAATLPAGRYLIQLSAGGEVLTRPAVLIP